MQTNIEKIEKSARLDKNLLNFKSEQDFKNYCKFLANTPKTAFENEHSFWNNCYKAKNGVLKNLEQKCDKYDLDKNARTRKDFELMLNRLLKTHALSDIKISQVSFLAHDNATQLIYADEYETLETLANLLDKKYIVPEHKTKFACMHFSDDNSARVSVYRILTKERKCQTTQI